MDAGPHIFDVDVDQSVGRCTNFLGNWEFSLTVEMADVDREVRAAIVDTIVVEPIRAARSNGPRCRSAFLARARMPELRCRRSASSRTGERLSTSRENASSCPAPSWTMPDQSETQLAFSLAAISIARLRKSIRRARAAGSGLTSVGSCLCSGSRRNRRSSFDYATQAVFFQRSRRLLRVACRVACRKD